jgi:hypothetical protein
MPELNYTIDQMDLDNVYRIVHPTSAQPMEPSPEMIISYGTKQTSANIRK